MKFAHAIDLYIADMRAEGRINSDTSERGYRKCLDVHADDAGNRDPRYTNRDDVKKTLSRWPHPNTRGNRRAILSSFYDWAMQELEPPRKDNPARQVRPPRRRKVNKYRLTKAEVIAFLDAAQGVRERRAVFVGVCAGARSQELRGLQGRHFKRKGWIWFSPDIAKGARERWVPVLPDLAAIAASLAALPDDVYVLPAQRWRDPGHNRVRRDLVLEPSSAQALYQLVKRVGRRAGIRAEISPHTMRHAFGDHIARYAGIRNAQYMLGHADVGTTQAYTGDPTLDELASAIGGFSFFTDRTPVLGGPDDPNKPPEAPTRIELVLAASRPVEPFLDGWPDRAASSVAVYAEHFGGAL